MFRDQSFLVLYGDWLENEGGGRYGHDSGRSRCAGVMFYFSISVHTKVEGFTNKGVGVGV